MQNVHANGISHSNNSLATLPDFFFFILLTNPIEYSPWGRGRHHLCSFSLISSPLTEEELLSLIDQDIQGPLLTSGKGYFAPEGSTWV